MPAPITVAVVFDIESSPPMPVGRYVRTDNDTVIYARPAGDHGYAPADCVTIVDVEPIAGNRRTVDELGVNLRGSTHYRLLA